MVLILLFFGIFCNRLDIYLMDSKKWIDFLSLATIKHAEKNNHVRAQFACWQTSLWEKSLQGELLGQSIHEFKSS